MKAHKRYQTYNWLFQRKEHRRRIIIIVNILLLLFGVVKISIAQDTLIRKTLSLEQVIEMVKKFHPVAKQADLFIEKSKAEIAIARGMFDPFFYNNAGQKTFDGIDYYYYNRPEVIIPTWFGIEIHAGLSYLSGSRTEPQDTKGETSYVGLTLPLVKNLLMDKRRAAVQTAKIFRKSSEADKRNIINNLLLDAINTYWDWVNQYQNYKIASQAVEVNTKRIDMVRIAYRQGERPAIDTTEALTQLQQYQLLKTQAWMKYQNEAINLSSFLWAPDDQPYLLPAEVVPDDHLLSLHISSVTIPELDQLLDIALRNHPELLQYDLKLDALSIQKKLKFQDLLPDVNFHYTQLGKGYEIGKTTNWPLFENNFRYRLSIGLPLRLSEGRGSYKKAKLDITTTRLGKLQKKLYVGNSIRGFYNELTAVKEQIRIQEKACYNYQILQRAEETKLMAGESTLFLVNSRETKSLEAMEKLAALKAKYFQLIASLSWAAGILISF